jgi:alanyl-tRNA synthetase
MRENDSVYIKLKSAIIVLTSVRDGKVSLIAGVAADLTDKYKAGELVNFVARQDRADMTLGSVRGWVEGKSQ